MQTVTDQELDIVLGKEKYEGLNRILLRSLTLETIRRKETDRISVKDAKLATLRVHFRPRNEAEREEQRRYGSAISSLLGRRGAYMANARRLIPKTRRTPPKPARIFPIENEKGQFEFSLS